MGRKPHTRRLAIWMNGQRVGEWTLARTHDAFAYDPRWLESPERRPISLSLPFTPDNAPYRGELVRAYFDNLLPDSDAIRQRLARRFGAASTDAFDLLEQVGRDCVGALQIVPADQAPPDVHRIEGRPLDEQGVAARLRAAVAPAAPFAAIGADDTDLRLSIAGAQEKTALLWHDGQWQEPRGATPTTHIFKLPMGRIGNLQLDMRQSVENEWLCSRIVAAFGLPVAHCDMATFEDQKVLVVQRFDRALAADGTWWLRLPQEDMCQATGTPPTLKYESDGGPGILPIMKLLGGSEQAAVDRATFFKAQILFWLLGAPDGHAKNFSIRLGAGGAYRLTPLYDVLSAYPVLGTGAGQIAPQKVKMAMAVRARNAHYRMADIQRRHWNAIAKRCGVADTAEDWIGELLGRAPQVIAKLRDELPPGFPRYLVDAVFDGLADAAARLERMPPE